MIAAILSIGDELTLGQNLDTNAAWLAAELLARSVVTVEHRTVPDDRAAIAESITALGQRVDLLLITGGLGPTDDDITRDALGDALTPGRDLVTDEEAERAVRAWFEGRARPMPAGNLRQAQRPETMRCVPNPRGTAPGLTGRYGPCLVFSIPGPPREMRPMFMEHVVPELPAADDATCVLTESVHMYGPGESWGAERLGVLTARDRAILVGTTASRGIITARIRVEGPRSTAPRDLDATVRAVERAWTPYCFGRGSATLVQAVGAELRERGASLVTAESCTGGWLGQRLVDVPGASAWYRGGWITYANEMKTSELGVPAGLIAQHGAVSSEVATVMATGALERGAAEYAVAITGVAGPGDEAAKPAGTVFIAIAASGAPTPPVRRFRFRGERGLVRDLSVKSALQLLRLHLLGTDAAGPLLGEAAPAPGAARTGGP